MAFWEVLVSGSQKYLANAGLYAGAKWWVKS